MDNKKIGDFIKGLLKSKGMNQEDLARVLNISPQAVSKSLNGSNTFDIQNLKIISDMFKVTIDDILAGELQTSVSFMTDQERVVKLGLNAIKSADKVLLNKRDEKERNVLHYAIEHQNSKVIKYLIDNRFFKNEYTYYILDTNHLTKNIVKVLIDNEMFSTLMKFFETALPKFSNIPQGVNKCIINCKELWETKNRQLIDKLYYKDTGDTKWNNEKEFINLNQAVRFNNEIVLKDWFEHYTENGRRGWRELPGVQTAIRFNNYSFLERLLSVIEESRYFRTVNTEIDIYEAYHSNPKICEFFLKIRDTKSTRISLRNVNKLMTEFYDNKEYDQLMNYRGLARISSKKLDTIDIEDIDLTELFYLFASGGMPEVVYNDKDSVEDYVDTVNEIILRLTKEIIDLKK